MACRHLFTAWRAVWHFFWGEVAVVRYMRECVYCHDTEDSSGHLERAA